MFIVQVVLILGATVSYMISMIALFWKGVVPCCKWHALAVAMLIPLLIIHG